MTLSRLVDRSLLRTFGLAAFPWAVACVLVATALRLVLDRWLEGVPFLTYFPATLVAGLFLGWRWGAAVLLTSAVMANYAFQPPYWAFAVSFKQLVSTLGFLLSGVLVLATTDGMRRLLIEANRARRREAELNLELSHRVQNNLAVVQSLAHQTARIHPEAATFYPAFRDRLLALSAAHTVLTTNAMEAAGLPELAEVALTAFRDQGRISLSGPACTLPSNAAVPLVLALHELATNASKYGALSRDEGQVRISWSLTGSNCVLAWRELDGPRVAPPTRVGLGSRLLRRQTGLEAVTQRFDPEGVCCEIVVANAEGLDESGRDPRGAPAGA